MNCQRVQDSFLDYQAGHLAAADATLVRQHLKTCLDCQRHWAGLQETLLKLDRLPDPGEPSPQLSARFYAMLDEEQASLETPSPFALVRTRLDAFCAALLPARPVLQFALTAFVLIAGLTVGMRLFNPPPPVQIPVADPATQRELAELRTRVESMGQLVHHSLQQTSANHRLQATLARFDTGRNDQQAFVELLNSLAFDPSTNVRLCALDSLYPHATNELVRSGVLASLQRESSPLVQVAMIDFLVAARERAAAPTLEQLTRSATIDKAVRDAAQRALAQL